MQAESFRDEGVGELQRSAGRHEVREGRVSRQRETLCENAPCVVVALQQPVDGPRQGLSGGISAFR